MTAPRHAFRLSHLACLALVLFVASSAFAGEPQAIVPMERANEILLSYPTPKYPLEARLKRMAGAGKFEVTVDPGNGAVVNVSVFKSTGFAILDRSAISTLGRWKFRPNTVKKVRVPVRFAL